MTVAEPRLPSGESGGVRRAVRYGWLPLLALAFTVFLENGERVSLSVAVEGDKGLQQAFHISDWQVGLIPFAMTVVGLVGSVFIGVLADRSRRTRLLAIAVAIWTGCMFLCGVAVSYLTLFIARLGVGAVEATSPAAVSLIGDYYPVEERAKKMGFYSLGGLVGAIVGYGGAGVAVAIGGWRWAFFFWVPLGVLGTLFMLRQPEPARGDQERDFDDSLHGTTTTTLTQADEQAADVLVDDELRVLEKISLPDPVRVGTFDYDHASWGDVLRELWQIKSMWYAVTGIAVAQLLLNGIGFWAIPYFERVHHLTKPQASGVAGLLAISSVAGIVGGGHLADRYFRRGQVNARIYIAVIGCVGGTVLLMAGFVSTSMYVTAPFFFFGGAFLSLPVAPSDAMLSDVIVAPLRGRAGTVRSVVRTLSGAGPLVIGILSQLLSHNAATGSAGAADGLRIAIVVFCPIYAIGGLFMLRAAKHYPKDLAFVLAESRRLELLSP